MEENKQMLHERILLSRLMLDKQDVIDNISRIQPEYFTIPENKAVYAAILSVVKKDQDIDFVSLSAILPHKEDLLIELDTMDVFNSSTESAIESLKETYRINRLKMIGNVLVSYNPSQNADSLIEYLNKEINKLSGEKKINIKEFHERCDDLISMIETNSENKKPTGIQTGLRDYDKFSRGFHKGDLIIIAAESSQGKTSLAITTAYNIATNTRIPTLFYSLEMSSRQLMARYTAFVTSTSPKILLYDNIPSGTTLNAVKSKINSIKDSNMFIDDSGISRYKHIEATIRRYVITKGVEIIYIDYLQLVSDEKKGQNKELEVGGIARKLKNLALELNIAIVLLSQLSRNKDNPIPSMSRLRQSGQIEEAADVIIMLYRPSYYGREYEVKGERVGESQAALLQTKGRNIGIDKFILNFNMDLTIFTDKDKNVYTESLDPNYRIESKNKEDDFNKEVPF